MTKLVTDFSPSKKRETAHINRHHHHNHHHHHRKRPLAFQKRCSLMTLFASGLIFFAVIIFFSTLLLPRPHQESDTITTTNSMFDILKNANMTNNNNKQSNNVQMKTSSATTSQEQREYWKQMLEKARAEFPHNPYHHQQKLKQQQQQGPELTSRQQWYPGHHVMVYNHHHHHPKEKEELHSSLDSFGRPPLNSLINKTHILVDPWNSTNSNSSINNIYNVSWLLNFAIIGFGKSGTSSILYWLSQQPNVATFHTEIWSFMEHQPQFMVEYLYRDLPPQQYYYRGYKGPSDVTQEYVINYFRIYFPYTKLIIGLRHPIRFFESLYNFRIQNYIPINNNDTTATAMPHPNKLIGRCVAGMQYTCTEKSNFAYYLLRLGKTQSSSSSRLAQEIVGYFKAAWYNLSNVPYTPNPVFLYHMEQLNRPALARDLLEYLNLSSSSSSSSTSASIVNSNSNSSTSTTMLHARPGKTWINAKIQENKNAQKIDICRDEYKPLRRDLLRIGRQSARWIQNEFLQSPDVTCSERDTIFLSYLQKWEYDPCKNNAEIITPMTSHGGSDFMIKMMHNHGGGGGGVHSPVQNEVFSEG